MVLIMASPVLPVTIMDTTKVFVAIIVIMVWTPMELVTSIMVGAGLILLAVTVVQLTSTANKEGEAPSGSDHL